MSLTSKYGCGCTPANVKQFGHTCCQSPLQSPPTPCCEAHEMLYTTGVCFYSMCQVTATAEPFYLTFGPGGANMIPMNMAEVYFYHQGAGLIQILSFDGTSYRVALKDPTKAGAQIQPSDCILVTVIPSLILPGSVVGRCLSGNFLAPAADAEPTPIYIANGSGIPVGSNLTFTWEGETGTYVVTSFESASGNIYVYNVQNTGNGLTPGTLVNGGVEGVCDVPIEIISQTEMCNLSATQILNTILGCYAGSPRALTPTGPLQAVVSGSIAPYPFGLQSITNFDCCVEIVGVLKFAAIEGCQTLDTVELKDINLDCFDAAVTKAFAHDNLLPVIISAMPFVVVEWDLATKTVTLAPVGDVYGGNPFVQFNSGTRICTGECCNTCIGGDQLTQVNFVGPGGDATKYSSFSFDDPGNIPYSSAGPLHYLIGVLPNGTTNIKALDASYHIGTGVFPKHTDPLLLRQKICNQSPKGCTQKLELFYNYELQFLQIPVAYRVHWSFGSLIGHSATLADGVTPNPFSYAASQSGSSGVAGGPSFVDSTITPGTLLAYGDAAAPKVWPFFQSEFSDRSRMRSCDCLNAIVWFYVLVEPLTGAAGSGNILMNMVIRRDMRLTDYNRIDYPSNNNALEGFN